MNNKDIDQNVSFKTQKKKLVSGGGGSIYWKGKVHRT